MTTARRSSVGRRRLGRRILAVAAIAAMTMGCVADTLSASVAGSAVAAAAGQAAPLGPAAARVPPTVMPSPAPVAPRPAPTPRPPSGPYLAPAPTPHPAGKGSLVTASENVPILYYHRVRALPAGYTSWSPAAKRRFLTYDTLPQAFAAQLDWLKTYGYTTILPRDLAAHWDTGKPLPVRPVIITFDDGSHDWVRTVLPMLQARGMVAEFYLTLDAVQFGNLTWKEARRLVKAGNGIGAHDVHHVQLTAFGNGHPDASPATMWSEVSEARRIIGVHVGVFPDSMAYVGGGYDATLERLVAEAGYTSARSINRGIAQTSSRRYRMRIVRIGAHDDVASLTRGTMVPGLPTFTKRMHGVPDK
ncbi:MAG TPA: polysaccharide deacetylase family protein [Candidatus Limnocylindrales bacterium]|nr:polysaccharide deacetylase family protein [Candidatus Limnocylindrales bacterium]